MGFLNNNDVPNVSSYTSWETPQYNKASSFDNDKTSVKFAPFYAQKPLTKEVNDNATVIVQVSKKLDGIGQEKAAFYIYGDRKNGWLNDIAQVLAEIVEGQDAKAAVSVTHLKSNTMLYEDIDLSIGKY